MIRLCQDVFPSKPQVDSHKHISAHNWKLTENPSNQNPLKRKEFREGIENILSRKPFLGGGSGGGMVSLPVLHDIVLPTIVTMFTVVLSVAACILLIIIKRQWETVPEYHSQQVGHTKHGTQYSTTSAINLQTLLEV